MTRITTALFLIVMFVISCSQKAPSTERELIGKWHLINMERYAVNNGDTSLIRQLPVPRTDFQILDFKSAHTVIQEMNGHRSSGTWSLRGNILTIDFPYRNRQPTIQRIFHPKKQQIITRYSTGDTMLFIATFSPFNTTSTSP